MNRQKIFVILAWFFAFENALVVFFSLISEPMQLIRAILTFISMIVFVYFAGVSQRNKSDKKAQQ